MTDNKKSKVTSIRVEPELYDSFKQTVESQDKQVTAVLSTLMKQYVQTTKREQMQAMLENIMSAQPTAEQFHTSLGLASDPTALGLELFTSQFDAALKHLNKYMATVCDITRTELTYDCVSIPQTNPGVHAFCLTCVVDGSQPQVAARMPFSIHSNCTVLSLRATHPEDGRDMLVPITKADIVEIANLFTEAEQRQFLSLIDKKFDTADANKSTFTGFGDLANGVAPLLATFQARGRVEQLDNLQVGADGSTLYYQTELLGSLPIVEKRFLISEYPTVQSAKEAAFKALETEFCGYYNNVDLESSNDSTGLYAGIRQDQVSTWAAAEISVSGSSLYGKANELLATMMTRGVDLHNICIFAPPATVQRLFVSAGISKPAGSTGMPSKHQFHGIPVVAVESLSPRSGSGFESMHFLDMTDARIKVSVEQTTSLFVVMGVLELKNRNRHGKLAQCDLSWS